MINTQFSVAQYWPSSACGGCSPREQPVQLSQPSDAFLPTGGLTPPATPKRIPEMGFQTALAATAAGAGVPGAVLAGMIDHTLLKPDATADQIKKLCAEARENNFASVCVQPSRVQLAAQELKDSPVMVCTVVGFPHGATSPEGKAEETRQAIRDGADEIDMVINVGKLKDRDDAAVRKDIEAVVDAAGEHTVKVIIETSLLSEEEKVRACQLSKAAGADFVKTSTGFNGGGATPEDIALMRQTVGPEMGVKASGGVKDARAANAVIAAGATRIGASSGIAIIQGGQGTGY